MGKDVQFSVQYTVSTMNPPRENGIVYLSGTNVLESAVSEGWVKLRESGRKDKTEEEENILANLKGSEDQAKAAGKGMWNTESHGKIDVKQEIGGKEKGFLDQWKGKDIDGILKILESNS